MDIVDGEDQRLLFGELMPEADLLDPILNQFKKKALDAIRMAQDPNYVPSPDLPTEVCVCVF